MGTTMDEIRYEESLLEEWKNEKKEAFEALKKIANSGNSSELVKNLKELKNVYISDKPVGNKNLNKAIGGINFEMIEFKKWNEEQFKEQKESGRKYFVYSSIVAVVVMFIGAIIGFTLCSVKDMVMDNSLR